ncbi:VOC family protein [Streptomyces sp. CA-278952]|uniref:VOC family protein n=1 Tax=Streptomyces sp. CA-278952 TaxID=2980556 RepID=UPI0023688739|nr:VOC family protein [Streptomyces sp. CA-278952]WDG33511.1 VOC family protein [Streptomyces sp. CA-278952]
MRTTRTTRSAVRGRGGGCSCSGVPEPKTVKNRLHIDVHSAPGQRDGEEARLVELGARVVRTFDERGGSWVVMMDPEDNEFCLS